MVAHLHDLAGAAGVQSPARIIPFRGEYYELAPDARHLVRGLIYPVPDPAFPFLGVHLTRGIEGAVHAGPNAVLAFAREGYRWRDAVPTELIDTLRSSAFRRLAVQHYRQGMVEMARSASRRLFLRSLQRLVPDLTDADLVPAAAGVRAQAVLDDGTLVDDFLILEEPGALHVLNAPSPAAELGLSASIQHPSVTAQQNVPPSDLRPPAPIIRPARRSSVPTIICGPPPARALATAARNATRQAPRSVASTVTPSMP